MGVGTRRLFLLGTVSLFALMVMHNALNFEIQDRKAWLRPGRLGVPKIELAQPFPLDEGGYEDKQRLTDTEMRPTEGRSTTSAIAVTSPIVRDAGPARSTAVPEPPPWSVVFTPIAPARHNYTDCSPRPGALGPTRHLDYIVAPDDPTGFPANCDREELRELCSIVRKVAIRREVLTAVCNSKIIGQLENFLKAVDAAGIKNVMIIALDQRLVDWLQEHRVAYYRKISTAAGSHKISAQKFRIVREFLEVGCSVLMSDIDIVWIRNPFDFMWRDADLEGATDGWDWETAYGWTEPLEDVTMGSARSVEGYRITAFNSGLWYLQATRGGLRMMQLLAHRMETEDTWDQTAFSQEASLPTHDGWLNAGITVRVMNHMCFCNSKTLLRAIRPDVALQQHRPVVVHVNYHQNKEKHMEDIAARYHHMDLDALDRTARQEPRTVRPIAEVEAPFWSELNDGFVSSAHIQPSVQVVRKASCAPGALTNPFLRRAPPRVAPACEESEEMRAVCAKVEEVAVDGEMALVVLAGQGVPALPVFTQAVHRAGVTNILVVANDSGDEPLADVDGAASPLHAAQDSGLPWMPASQVLPAGALQALPRGPALRWSVLRQVLRSSTSVLLLEPSVVVISNPFKALYRDSDIEAASAGWDDPSAYGYNHVLDDPTMGFTRFCHGSRIVARDPALVFALATDDAVRFADVMVRRIRAHALPSASPKTERQLFSEEVWLPSSPTVARAGAVSRVMNYLCFASSKVLWRTINRVPQLRASHSPVAVSLPQTAELVSRMRAVIDRYQNGQTEALDKFPIGDVMPEFSGEVCDSTRGLKPAVGATANSEWLQRVTSEAWTWAGVKEITFDADGTLRTPWGQGKWVVVPDKENMISATFIGRQHILLFSWSPTRGPQFISSRCDDADVVLGRPLSAPAVKRGAIS